ncbi:MAG: COGs COG2343, partial [uncultured Craurococcus sp.]
EAARTGPSHHHHADAAARARPPRRPGGGGDDAGADPAGSQLPRRAVHPPRGCGDGAARPHAPQHPLPVQGRCQLLQHRRRRPAGRERGLELRIPLPRRGRHRGPPRLLPGPGGRDRDRL